jgi:DNA-binding beta-propeller fold protein YncE
MNGATGITLDSHGLVYVTDYDDDRVLVFATQSPVPTRTSTWGALKATYR